MTTAIIEQQAAVNLVSPEPRAKATSPDNGTIPARDMRLSGLGASGRRLGMRIADLGPLQVRRAKADLVHCPICPGH
jgi:hypothetical protein